MVSVDHVFYDHSTITGKISMYLNRINWKYVTGAALMIGLVTVGLLMVSTSSSDNDSLTSFTKINFAPTASALRLSDPSIYPQVGPPGILRKAPSSPFAKNAWDTTKDSPPGTFQSEGCENGLMNFEGFPPTLDKGTTQTLKIRDLIIDAAKFSQELEGWTSLESIVIENAWISGDFSQVYLPKLTKFIFHQFHNAKTDSYKFPEKLKSILFFDKIEGQSWDLEKDVLNLNVTIQVTIGGNKLLQVEPEFGYIVINAHNCEEYFKNLNGTFAVSTLSLHWCPVTNASIHKIPKDLTFLQLNNAVLSNEDLSTVINSLDKLKELHTFLRFHCEWPGYEIFLNISQLPETLETLSVTNLDISYSPNKASNVKNLSIGNYITPSLIPNFGNVFKSLKSVAIFNLTATDAYPLLQQVIKNQVDWILVSNLTRASVKDRSTNSVRVVEFFLNTAGIPKGQTCFILECNNGTYSGRIITDFERHFYRYTRLEFDKLETYENYILYDAFPK